MTDIQSPQNLPALFLKEDMTGTNYYWPGQDGKQVFTGTPTRRLFDRYNGDQVLFIINYYGAQSAGFSIEQGKLIELEIAHRLPMEAKSEISVFNWIQALLISTSTETINA